MDIVHDGHLVDEAALTLEYQEYVEGAAPLTNVDDAFVEDALIRLCVFTSTERLSKAFELNPDGTLRKESGGHMVRGSAQNTKIKDLSRLKDLIATLTPEQGLAFGTHNSPKNPVPLTVKDKVKDHPGHIARSREFFAYRDGQPGILLLDYDPPKGEACEEPLSTAVFWDTISTAIPALKGCEHLIISSASSYIYGQRDGAELIGAGGLHCFVTVENAADIPQIGGAITSRLWLSGLGRFETTKGGQVVKRSLVDGGVWQAERLSFDAGAACGEGLEQRRPDPLYVSGGMLALAAVALSPDEQQRADDLMGIHVPTDGTKAAARTTHEPANRAEIVDALAGIPADVGYDEWLKIGMALRSLGDAGLDLWDDWSRKGEKYPGRPEMEKKWASFDPDGAVGIGTLFHMAQQYGYRRVGSEGTTLVAVAGEENAAALNAAGIFAVECYAAQPSIHVDRLVGVSTLVVLGASDGLYMEKGRFPKNTVNLIHHDLFQLKNGKYVIDDRSYYDTLALAKILRDTLVDLKVGVAFVPLQIEASQGPRGGDKKVLVKARTEAAEAISCGLVDAMRTSIEFAARKAEAFSPDNPSEGCVPLGFVGGDQIAVWSRPQETLRVLKSRDVNSIGELTTLMGKEHLEKHYPKFSREGEMSINVQKATVDIVDGCNKKGPFFSEGRVFGFGTWREDGGDGVVVNTGSGVVRADGSPVERIEDGRKPLYIPDGKNPPPAYRPVSDAEYHAVLEKIEGALDTWQYASKIGGELVLGWLVMTVFLGAMTSRPHIWVVAPRGAGKSQLAKYCKSVLGDYGWHTDMGKESTSAGIRQALRMSSSPCILDEMEKNNTSLSNQEESTVAGIMSLLRSAYTASSGVRKGTAEGNGRDYHVMTSFLCVSIADPGLGTADLTRIAKIYLKPIQHNGQIGKPPALLCEEDAAAFFWGTIQRWKRYLSVADAVRDNWLAVAGNGEAREMDTFGVLLAAALAARDCPVNQVRGMLDMAVPELMDQVQEVRDASSEHDLILETLMSLHIEVQRHDNTLGGSPIILREKMTIGGAVDVARRASAETDEAKALAAVGLAVRKRDGKDHLAIALRHAALANLFQGTQWRNDGAWTGGLRDVPGAIRNHPVSFDSRQRKCTLVPLPERVVEDDSTGGGKTGTVVALPPRGGFGASNMGRRGGVYEHPSSWPAAPFADLDSGNPDDDWSRIPL